MATSPVTSTTPSVGKKRSNIRTALVLLSMASVFFAGVILNRYWFEPAVKPTQKAGQVIPAKVMPAQIPQAAPSAVKP
jgi:hypothetical protein